MAKLTLRRWQIKRCSVALAALLLSACQQTPIASGEAERLYDFDHKVHFEQTQYSQDRYRLAIKPDSYAHFNRQSVFLLRHAKRLCSGRQPQLTLIKGVQEYERLPLTPRPYQHDLTVEVRCVKD